MADIAHLKALEAQATKGPWAYGAYFLTCGVNDGTHRDWVPPASIKPGRCADCSHEPEPCSFVLPASESDGTRHVSRFDATLDEYGVDGETTRSEPNWHIIASEATRSAITGNYDYEAGGVCSSKGDTELIVALRNAAPALLEVCAAAKEWADVDCELDAMAQARATNRLIRAVRAMEASRG